jgi:hypothetical protein
MTRKDDPLVVTGVGTASERKSLSQQIFNDQYKALIVHLHCSFAREDRVGVGR